MTKGIFFICTLFVVLTGFNQQERVVEQGNADLLGRASAGVEAPKISQPLGNFSINEGGIATFIARFTPSKCNVAWYKGNTPVVKSDRIDIYTEDEKTTLVIDQACLSDDEFYRVVISNDAGKVESIARLIVRPE